MREFRGERRLGENFFGEDSRRVGENGESEGRKKMADKPYKKIFSGETENGGERESANFLLTAVPLAIASLFAEFSSLGKSSLNFLSSERRRGKVH